MQPVLCDARGGAQLLSLGERKFHQLRARPDFPRPIVLGGRSVRWKTAELIAWADSQMAAGDIDLPKRPQLERHWRRGKKDPVAGKDPGPDEKAEFPALAATPKSVEPCATGGAQP